MTRFLSQALETKEPYFRHELMELEAANGHPNADIRLSTEIMHSARNKCRELGLDPSDTTAEELYHALIERIKADDRRLTMKLRMIAGTKVSAEADPMSGMTLALKELNDSKVSFALKTSKLRSILKSLAPKKTMKAIGYRSVDSMLKHESPVEVLAFAWLVEPAIWQKKLLSEYRKLQPSDFEERPIRVIYPKDKRYRTISEKLVNDFHHNVLCLKELGTIVILPLPEHAPVGSVTSAISLALHEMNEIRATSNYLKIQQFKPGFGSMLAKCTLQAPELASTIFDSPVSWNLIQRYYARFKEEINEAVFEPYLSLSDMSYHAIEESLEKIEPGLSFWRGTEKLGLMEDNRAVSLNLIDNALNLCNKLSFENRLTHYFQNSLLSELLMKYLNHDAIIGELQPELATAEVN
ncbi:MAG TPA: hypothetical protein VFN31_02450 [Candidatus Saccharimonadales bacterium]|nr:hypothetical protein [Candidatus Saccharimonadales bacterium]